MPRAFTCLDHPRHRTTTDECPAARPKRFAFATEASPSTYRPDERFRVLTRTNVERARARTA